MDPIWLFSLDPNNKKELHQRYRQLIKENHPDTHPNIPDANEKTAKIVEEYNKYKDYFDK